MLFRSALKRLESVIFLISISYVWNGDSKEVDIASYRMQLQLYCNIMGVYCLMSYRDETFLLYKNDEWRRTE